MYRFLKLSSTEKEPIIENSARLMNLSPAMIEKDFWVCLTLD